MNKVKVQFDLQELLCEAMQNKAESSIGKPLDSYEIAQIREIVKKHIIDDTIDYRWQVQEEAQRIRKDKIRQIIGESVNFCLAVVNAKHCDLVKMPRLIKNFIEAHANLLEIVTDPIYNEQLEYDYKYYHASTLDFKAGRFTCGYLKSPQQYDPQKIGTDVFETVIEEYKKYWEDTISCMVKKPAIRERRRHIINELDEVLTNGLSNSYPDIMIELRKYQEFNVAEIEKLTVLIISKN